MFKRFGLFIIMNIVVVVTVSLILNLLGVEPYLTPYGLDYKSLAAFCAVWGMVGSFISLAISKFTAKKLMGVQVVGEQSQYSSLVNRVHRLSKAAGINKMPEVGIYNSPEVNAFATGPSKNNSLVAVSTGLLNSMTEDEVEGVLAHEVAHVANGDMVTMALVQGVLNAFVMFFARIAAFALQNAMRSDDDDSPTTGGWSYIVTTMVFEVIFGLFAGIIVAFFSRYREFRADQGGAKLAGRDKMINALKRLQVQFEGGGVFEKETQMSAFKISSKKSGFARLFSTHPPLEERIKALQMLR